MKTSFYQRLHVSFMISSLSFSCLFLSCSESFINRDPTGTMLPTMNGISLDQKTWTLPKDILGKESILLLGYVQDAQFDIDRWLIGLDMRSAKSKIYEIPTIKGMIPRMISARINEGMRSGIPSQLWGGVITVYKDGERIQRFTGNQQPRNARVLLTDREGRIRFFTDEGFSVPGLNRLLQALNELQSSKGPRSSLADE